MELDDIALVQESLERVLGRADEALSLFCARVFNLDPALRSFWPAATASHGHDFLVALHQAVAGLHAPESIMAAIKESGRLHAARGVRPAHYHTFGQAWLWTLARLQGESFTTETAEAWTQFYHLLVGLMKEAAAGVTTPSG
jgi:hemoglobin-like flavoprotein